MRGGNFEFPWHGASWIIPAQTLHGGHKHIGDQHQQEPGAKFGERHGRPPGGLMWIDPGARESAGILGDPDEHGDEEEA